ncbi:MAG: hypothetical protein HGA75_13410 [Thiobacillus sp.]|nr:hypothetical protein [Thiobacillus sp.]
MSQFKPCAGKTACRDDNVHCLVCGRSLAAIEATRRLIDGLAELAMAEDYENVDEFAAYVASKVVKKVRHRREGSSSTD